MQHQDITQLNKLKAFLKRIRDARRFDSEIGSKDTKDLAEIINYTYDYTYTETKYIRPTRWAPSTEFGYTNGPSIEVEDLSAAPVPTQIDTTETRQPLNYNHVLKEVLISNEEINKKISELTDKMATGDATAFELMDLVDEQNAMFDCMKHAITTALDTKVCNAQYSDNLKKCIVWAIDKKDYALVEEILNKTNAQSITLLDDFVINDKKEKDNLLNYFLQQDTESKQKSNCELLLLARKTLEKFKQLFDELGRCGYAKDFIGHKQEVSDKLKSDFKLAMQAYDEWKQSKSKFVNHPKYEKLDAHINAYFEACFNISTTNTLELENFIKASGNAKFKAAAEELKTKRVEYEAQAAKIAQGKKEEQKRQNDFNIYLHVWMSQRLANLCDSVEFKDKKGEFLTGIQKAGLKDSYHNNRDIKNSKQLKEYLTSIFLDPTLTLSTKLAKITDQLLTAYNTIMDRFQHRFFNYPSQTAEGIKGVLNTLTSELKDKGYSCSLNLNKKHSYISGLSKVNERLDAREKLSDFVKPEPKHVPQAPKRK